MEYIGKQKYVCSNNASKFSYPTTNFLYHKNMLMNYIEKQMVIMQLKYPFKK
jgi:hypothetical protein